jgi:hypothetical protein
MFVTFGHFLVHGDFFSPLMTMTTTSGWDLEGLVSVPHRGYWNATRHFDDLVARLDEHHDWNWHEPNIPGRRQICSIALCRSFAKCTRSHCDVGSACASFCAETNCTQPSLGHHFLFSKHLAFSSRKNLLHVVSKTFGFVFRRKILKISIFTKNRLWYGHCHERWWRCRPLLALLTLKA